MEKILFIGSILIVLIQSSKQHSLKCKQEILIPNLIDCSSYYKIGTHGNLCSKTCPVGKYFNCFNKKCQGEIWPPCCQDDPKVSEIPSSYKCEKEEAVIKDAKHCGRFYTCDNSKIWTHECPVGEDFDSDLKDCVTDKNCNPTNKSISNFRRTNFNPKISYPIDHTNSTENIEVDSLSKGSEVLKRLYTFDKDYIDGVRELAYRDGNERKEKTSNITDIVATDSKRTELVSKVMKELWGFGQDPEKTKIIDFLRKETVDKTTSKQKKIGISDRHTTSKYSNRQSSKISALNETKEEIDLESVNKEISFEETKTTPIVKGSIEVSSFDTDDDHINTASGLNLITTDANIINETFGEQSIIGGIYLSKTSLRELETTSVINEYTTFSDYSTIIDQSEANITVENIVLSNKENAHTTEKSNTSLTTVSLLLPQSPISGYDHINDELHILDRKKKLKEILNFEESTTFTTPMATSEATIFSTINDYTRFLVFPTIGQSDSKTKTDLLTRGSEIIATVLSAASQMEKEHETTPDGLLISENDQKESRNILDEKSEYSTITPQTSSEHTDKSTLTQIISETTPIYSVTEVTIRTELSSTNGAIIETIEQTTNKKRQDQEPKYPSIDGSAETDETTNMNPTTYVSANDRNILQTKEITLINNYQTTTTLNDIHSTQTELKTTARPTIKKTKPNIKKPSTPMSYQKTPQTLSCRKNAPVKFMADPTKCNQFITCERHHLQKHTCDNGGNWDCMKNSCTRLTNGCCDHSMKEGLFIFCRTNGQKAAYATDDKKYFECVKNKIVLKNCLNNMKFDMEKGICDKGSSILRKLMYGYYTMFFLDLLKNLEKLRKIDTLNASNVNCSIERDTYGNYDNCNSYYECFNGRAVERKCPLGMKWHCFWEMCSLSNFPPCCAKDPNVSKGLKVFGSSCLWNGKTAPNPGNLSQYFSCERHVIVKKSCQKGIYNKYLNKCV